MTAAAPEGSGAGPASASGTAPDAAEELRHLAGLPPEERVAALAATVRRLEEALEATDTGSARS